MRLQPAELNWYFRAETDLLIFSVRRVLTRIHQFQAIHGDICAAIYHFGQRGKQIELISNGTRSSTDGPFRGSFQKTLVNGKLPVRSSLLCVSVSRDRQDRSTSNRDNLTGGDWKKRGTAQCPHCARCKKRERGGCKLCFNLASVLTRKTAWLTSNDKTVFYCNIFGGESVLQTQLCYHLNGQKQVVYHLEKIPEISVGNFSVR